MWSREKVRTAGREAFKRNYWKCVLFNLFLSLVVGGSAVHYSYNGNNNNYHFDRYGSNNTYDFNSNIFGHNEHFSGSWNPAMVVGFVFGFVIAFFFILAIALLIQAFVVNPIEVGARRFYFKNLREPAKMQEMAYGYDTNYKNVVKTLFLRDLYTFLWTCLFIIPGIIKFYEYAMIPYLLADNPDMTTEEAFAESKRMMTGEKWNAFVLDLSFIGWFILSALTFGILWIFYVGPYWNSTRAALYDALRIMKSRQPYNNYQQPAQPQQPVQDAWSQPAEPPVANVTEEVKELEKTEFGMDTPDPDNTGNTTDTE